MSEQLGRVLGGRYRLVAAIGTGASAQVFLADDLTLQRKVAVKVLHPALATDEAFLRRFRAEARAAAALSHPNLMAVYDWGEDDGPYLVLEYLGGGSLRSVLDRGGRLTPAQALVVGLEAARALDVAHRSGFVHRDIKPANLLFGEDGRLRIADFGLARALSEAGWTEPGDGLVGTARYAAPEQARGGRVDGKADVYSLGLVLVEAVTGSVPLVREGALETMMARVETSVPVPEELGPLQEVLERCGRADPAERLDAAELGRAMVAAAREMERPAPLTLPGHDLASTHDDITVFPDGDDLTVFRADATGVLPAVAPRRRRRWPWVLLALLVAAAVTAGAVFASQQLATPSAEVPGVVTKPVAVARAAIEEVDEADTDVDWTIDEEPVFDDNVPAGNVVAQRPLEGSDLEDGGTITLVVSRGPPPVDVPGLDNATLESATAALAAVDLKVGAVRPEHHEVVPEGTVITWKFGEELRPAQVPKFSAVDLVVSAGPAQREIPGLRGKAPGEAKAQLEQLGLVYAEAPREFSDDVPEGQVIGTSPGAGQRVERGATVTVVVSKGQDLVTVPDVRGKSYDDALAELEAAGLVGGDVAGRGNTVRATDPPGGERVRRGTEVSMLLGR